MTITLSFGSIFFQNGESMMFCHDFIHIKPNLFDFSIADSAIDVRPAININRLLKKK